MFLEREVVNFSYPIVLSSIHPTVLKMNRELNRILNANTLASCVASFSRELAPSESMKNTQVLELVSNKGRLHSHNPYVQALVSPSTLNPLPLISNN